MTFEDYRHFIPIQIRFSDIDRLQHVNNACYHNYVELGRVRYFNDVLDAAINWDLQGFILARTEIDHLEPLFLNDEAYCFTKVCRLGNKSITMKSAIVKKATNGLLACAQITGVLVAMDYERDQSILVPEEWKDRFRGFEGDLT